MIVLLVAKVYYADFTAYDKTKVMASSTPEPL